MKKASLLLILLVMNLWSAQAQSFRGSRTDFRDETIYFLIPTRFYDGDPSNNTQCWDNRDKNSGDPAWRGDFKGIIEKLDYIKALGFTAIWITPVVQNASGYDYHGYHAMDFSRVDHRFESDDVTLQTLIDAVHQRGMKIIIDIVINHTGNFGEENLCKQFERDWTKPQSQMNECMVPVTQKDGGRLPDNYLDLGGGKQYDARLAQMKTPQYDTHNLWHHFGHFNWDNETRWWAQIAGDCVDLNTENPQVSQYLVDCYSKFINMGADGFRIDTGGHVARLTFNNNFLPQLHAAAEAAKDKRGGTPFFMYAEVCSRFTSWWYRNQPALSCPFYTWKEQKQYDWDYDAASWYTLTIPNNESTDFEHVNMKSCEEHYNDNKEGTESKQPTSTNAFLQGNDYHTPDYTQYSGLSVIDFPMHHSFKDISSAWGIRQGDKYYNDATMNVVYVDSHDYAPNGAPESQRFAQPQSTWAENLDLMFTFRGIPCLYYGSEIEFRKGKEIDKGTSEALRNTGRAYYGGYIKGNVTATDFGQYANASGNMAQTLSHPLAQHIRRLNLIRAAVPALRKGQYSTDGCSGSYAFKRRYTDDQTDSYALVTINGNATFTNVLNGTYTDCVTGDVKTVTNGTLTASCSGKGNMRVYVLSTEKTPAPGKIGEDGVYLYATTPATATQPQWDGTEEEDSENNGDPGASPDPSTDDLSIYTPTVTESELSVFLETQYKGATIWVWNGSENFTGGDWNSKPSMQVMGKTADGQRRILKWTYDKSTYKNLPTGVIFVPTGQNQTSDLQYVNHGYYIEGQYDHTVTNTSGIVDVRSKRSDVRSDIYDLQGRKLNTCPTKPGVYIWNGKLYRK
jgi:glycosidase